MNIDNFPNPPMNNTGYQNFQQPVNIQQAPNPSGGPPIQVESYRQPIDAHGNAAISFDGLIKNTGYRTVNQSTYNPPAMVPAQQTTAVTKKRGRKKKEDSEPVNSKEIVESTVYNDSYIDTNNMAYGVIAQADEILSNAKMEFDYIRSRNTMKGKYMYMTNMISSMSSLMATKLQAIREINSNITKANDMEYRRFKDNRAILATDDNKVIMDAYKAYISTPVGAGAGLNYYQPSTQDITMAASGAPQMVPAGSPQSGTGTNMVQADPGYSNYLNTLSPEDNMMLNENNPDIEEVIVYDQATGMKYFQWMNTKTGEKVPNMPISSNILIEDFVIDPKTRTAKNTNLRQVKKVVYINENQFNQY